MTTRTPLPGALLVERARVPVLVAAWTVVAVLAACGTVAAATDREVLGAFDLDAELGAAAVLSATLLCLAAAGLAVGLLARREPVLTAVLPCFLVFMAADEFAYLHERAETRTGVDWQLLYLPVVALAGVAWLLVLRRWWSTGRPAKLLVAGAAAWVVAQVLEAVQWGPEDLPVDQYVLLSTVEEVLEAGGSVLFLAAGLAAARLGRRA